MTYHRFLAHRCLCLTLTRRTILTPTATTPTHTVVTHDIHKPQLNLPLITQMFIQMDNRQRGFLFHPAMTYTDIVKEIIEANVCEDTVSSYRFWIGSKLVNSHDNTPLANYGLGSSYSTIRIVHNSQRLLGGSNPNRNPGRNPLSEQERDEAATNYALDHPEDSDEEDGDSLISEVAE